MKLETLLSKLSIQEIGPAQMDIREFRLANGLTVLIHEDHIAPVITHGLSFKVGSVNEGAGETGSTHFLEHMAFMGTDLFSPDTNNGYDQLLVPIGAVNNAMTWTDWTIYHEVGASEHIELFIRMSADRMRNLKLRQVKQVSEMTVVRNEMEQGENDPAETLQQMLNATAYRAFPYHHDTIGYRSDVEGMPLSVLQGHYDRYYWPNNATVMLSGDLDLQQALRLVHKYYAAVPASPHAIPAVYTKEPEQEGERRFEVIKPGPFKMVVMAFHVPEAAHPDHFPLAVLDHVLGNDSDRTSRLYKRFVKTGLCVHIHSTVERKRYPGLFKVQAVLTPGTDHRTVEDAILAELADCATELCTEEELERVKKANSRSTKLRFSNANTLLLDVLQADAQSGWRWLANYDAYFSAVTAEEVLRVSKQYFTRKNRTVGYFVPEAVSETVDSDNGGYGTQDAPAAEPAAEPVAEVKTSPKKARRVYPRRTVKVKKGQRISYAKQAVVKKLANGITVTVLPNPGNGVVGLNVALKAGAAYQTKQESSIADLTAGLLGAGSANYPKERVAEILLEMGVELNWRTSMLYTAVGTTVDATDLSQLLGIIADQLRNPSFEQEELDRLRLRKLAKIDDLAEDPGFIAGRAFNTALYPEGHLLRSLPLETVRQNVSSATVAKLREFHQRCYVPSSLAVTFVGDVTVEDALACVNQFFSDWTGGEAPTLPTSTVPDGGSATVRTSMPAKSTVDIVIGLPVDLVLGDKEMLAYILGNAVLGQDTMMSRLGAYLRVEKGFTYGANSGLDEPGVRGGSWSLSLSVNPEVVDEAIRSALDIINDCVSAGITREEFVMAKGMVGGLKKLSLAKRVSIAAALSEIVLSGRSFSEIDNLDDEIDATTKEEVEAVLRKYIRPDKLTISLAGTFSK